jgi:tetratricopeptide (TPR) repeat protein
MKDREPTASPRAEGRPARRPRWPGRHRLSAVLTVLATLAIGGYFGYEQYRVSRLAGTVRRLFAARRYDEARGPLQRWLGERPHSGEAQYYRGWLALVNEQPQEAVEAVDQARRLGFDRIPLEVLAAIYQARAGRINAAEPILRQAFDRKLEPQAEVARELARIYLATYRLPQATEIVERCRELVPTDPQPYMWSNEIGSRSGASASIMIRNYRAALERDPALDKARLGLAEQLSKDRQFDEADQEYRAYLRRNPKDAPALVGLGRNAFQNGDIDEAIRQFEAAVAVDPRQADALKELAQLDLRFGRFAEARRRLELLTQVEPFDHEIRYSYAQALRLVGDQAKARAEAERAAQLRKEHEHIVQLRFKILKDPADLASRFEVARWMLDHGHANEGLKWAKEILRADPRHAATHQALADYYAKQGDPGLANYHRAMATSSQDAR